MNAVLQLPLPALIIEEWKALYVLSGKDVGSLYPLSGNLSSSVTVAVTWGYGYASVTQVDPLTARGQRPLSLTAWHRARAGRYTPWGWLPLKNLKLPP